MPTLDELLVRIDASTELLRRELKKGTADVSGFERGTTKSLDKIDSRFSALGRGIKTALATLGVGLSLRGLQNLTVETIRFADSLNDAAKIADVSAESLQELRFAFSQLAGTTDREVDESLRRFQRRLGLAIQGQGEAIKAYRTLGIQVKDSNGNLRETEAVLEDVLKSLGAVRNEAVRAALASQVFGEDAGPKLAAALKDGVDAMKALRAATPGVLSNENVALAAQLADKFDELARTVKGGFTNSIIEASTALADLFGLIERGPQIESALRLREAEDAVTQLLGSPLGRLLGENTPGLAGARAAAEAAREEARIAGLVQPFGERRSAITANLAARSQAAADARLLSPAFLRSLSTARNVAIRNPFEESQLDLLRSLPSARNVSLSPGADAEQAGFLGRLGTGRNVMTANLAEFEDEYGDFLDRVIAENLSATENMSDDWVAFGDSLHSSLRSTLSNAFQGIETDFGEMLRRMVADLVASGLLRVIGGAIGGPFGSLIAGGLPARAHGGPVSAGRAYMVGERGAEAFVPNVSGRIEPNIGGVTVNQTNYFPTNLRDVQAEIAKAAPMIARATEAKINETRARRQ